MSKLWVVAGVLGCVVGLGCGEDDPDPTSPGVAAACQKACQRVQGPDCALSTCLEQCKAKEREAPMCAAPLQASLECTPDASTLGCVRGDLADDECNYGPRLEWMGR